MHKSNKNKVIEFDEKTSQLLKDYMKIISLAPEVL